MEATLRMSLRVGGDRQDRDADISEIVAILVKAGAERAVRPVFGEPKDGWRAAEAEAADVVATLGSSISLLSQVITALRGWLAPRPPRTIKLVIDGQAIEISGLSQEGQDRLIDVYVRQVCERP